MAVWQPDWAGQWAGLGAVDLPKSALGLYPEQDEAMVEDAALDEAIGRVVRASAEFDSVLRLFVGRVALLGDAGWLLLEGTSSEWLAQTVPAVLEEADPYGRRFDPEDASAIRSCVVTSKTLRRVRNAVVHGTWSHEPLLDPESRRSGTRLPRRSDDERLYFCIVSRTRRLFDEWEFTASDVSLLAEEYVELIERFHAAAARMRAPRKPPESEEEGGMTAPVSP